MIIQDDRIIVIAPRFAAVFLQLVANVFREILILVLLEIFFYYLIP